MLFGPRRSLARFIGGSATPPDPSPAACQRVQTQLLPLPEVLDDGADDVVEPHAGLVAYEVVHL